MKKAIGTVLLGFFTVCVVLGVVALWNGHRTAQEGFNLVWDLSGAIATLLGLVGGYFTLTPRIDFGPINTSFESFPCELLFQVRNTGLFVLADITCEIADFNMTADVSRRPIILYTHDPEGRLKGQKVRKFSAIKPEHGETLDVAKMMPLLMQQPDSAQVSFRISCRQRVVPLKCNHKYAYKLFKTIDGKYAWSEVSEES